MATLALVLIVCAAEAQTPPPPQHIIQSVPVLPDTLADPPAAPLQAKVSSKSRKFVAGEMNLITIEGVDFETYARSKVIMEIYPKDGSVQMVDNLSVAQKKVLINVQPRRRGPAARYWFVFVIGGGGEFVYLEYPFEVVDREIIKQERKQEAPKQ